MVVHGTYKKAWQLIKDQVSCVADRLCDCFTSIALPGMTGPEQDEERAHTLFIWLTGRRKCYQW